MSTLLRKQRYRRLNVFTISSIYAPTTILPGSPFASDKTSVLGNIFLYIILCRRVRFTVSVGSIFFPSTGTTHGCKRSYDPLDVFSRLVKHTMNNIIVLLRCTHIIFTNGGKKKRATHCHYATAHGSSIQTKSRVWRRGGGGNTRVERKHTHIPVPIRYTKSVRTQTEYKRT